MNEIKWKSKKYSANSSFLCGTISDFTFHITGEKKEIYLWQICFNEEKVIKIGKYKSIYRAKKAAQTLIKNQEAAE